MFKSLLAASLLLWGGVSAFAATGTSVSWSIGRSVSTVDGIANAGPVTFTWTFDREVEYGTYVDGTPWVLWEDGLRLVAVSPAGTTMDVPDYGAETVTDCHIDLTCINLPEDMLPLDGRMGDKFDSALVWDGMPVALSAGDCIATGRGRRDARSAFRKMILTAIGVCNIVTDDKTGHYRPPIRMPADLRAALVTPLQAAVESLPSFTVPDPADWNGNPVTLDLSGSTDADNLLNGPLANCGIYGHTWYETGNAQLNHDLGGTADGAYQRDVANRFAACLNTAFDPSVETEKRQRCLDKFVQTGLDYFYMHCLGYRPWNSGGGHSNGLEGAITLAGAILGDSTITNAVKYQRFPGYVVGRDTVIDMMGGSDFARTEALYMVAPAPWRSGTFYQRSRGTGAAALNECVTRLDMAHPGHVLNNRDVPYTAVTDMDSFTVVTVGTSFVWPMWSINRATEARRSVHKIQGAVIRLDGDARIRRIVGFKRTPTRDWTEAAWNDTAAGRGGALFVYPALTAQERSVIGTAGTLTTGICTRNDAENGEVVLWESWAADDSAQVLAQFYNTAHHDYLGIKLGGNLLWLPYYHILDDPGAPGKKMYEESAGYGLMVDFFEMLRRNGSYSWDTFTSDVNVPDSPTTQALTMHYLFGSVPVNGFSKTYDLSDDMWNEEPSAVRTVAAPPAALMQAYPGLVTRATFLRNYTEAQLYLPGGTPVTLAPPGTGIYLVKFTADAPVQAVILYD